MPMISVTATASVIARPADFEIETGASSARSLSHMLTMMRKYKNAAITAASIAATAKKTAVYKDERFSDHAPLTVDYDWKL